jgi:quercetin dioxygenase-like cupin family protein
VDLRIAFEVYSDRPIAAQETRAVTQSTPDLRSRLVRYADLCPCRNAFIDSRTPGSERKENFTIIGPGVAENPDQHVHLGLPHGFNIGGARQPPRCVNSQHSHETAEVFIVLSGAWAFRSGERAQDGEAVIGPGDVVSLPVHMFRGFENIGDDVGFLFAVLGGDDPGRVTWAPSVFDAARSYGLILLESGRLIDTTLGQTVPEGARLMRPTTAQDVARMTHYSTDDLRAVVLPAAEMTPAPDSVLAVRATGGLRETPIIGDASEAEGLPAGRMAWPHGFHLRRLVLDPGASVPEHVRVEEEVLLMHSGTLRFEGGDDTIDLGPGDVFSVPKGLARCYGNPGADPATVYVVRGGDRPAAPQWKA